MKAYTKRNKPVKSVEVLLNSNELEILVNSLTDFQRRIKQFKADNAGKKGLGFTHLHTQDCGLPLESSETDLVFYVNLDA